MDLPAPGSLVVTALFIQTVSPSPKTSSGTFFVEDLADTLWSMREFVNISQKIGRTHSLTVALVSRELRIASQEFPDCAVEPTWACGNGKGVASERTST